MSAATIDLNLRLERADFALATDLQLPARGITVLFGPSGSGKTTVLRCVAGLEAAQGKVVINGEVWQDSEKKVFRPTWQRDLGYVFQEASLFAHLNVKSNLNYGIKRIRKPDATRALSEAIELLGIGQLLDRDPASLSGGERQRVAIARALAMQPRLLLLDEPLASLDTVRRQEILPWLERLHTELSIPVLYVTHAMNELTRLADHVVLLDRGRVQLNGAIENVLADPRFAASVGGEAGAILHGTICGHDAEFGLSGIDLQGTRLWVKRHDVAVGSPVRLHVHATDVSLALHEPADSSIQNRLFGEITGVYDDAHPWSQIVVLRHGQQQLLCRVTRKACHELGLRVGMSVWALMKSVALTGH